MKSQTHPENKHFTHRVLYFQGIAKEDDGPAEQVTCGQKPHHKVPLGVESTLKSGARKKVSIWAHVPQANHVAVLQAKTRPETVSKNRNILGKQANRLKDVSG